MAFMSILLQDECMNYSCVCPMIASNVKNDAPYRKSPHSSMQFFGTSFRVNANYQQRCSICRSWAQADSHHRRFRCAFRCCWWTGRCLWLNIVYSKPWAFPPWPLKMTLIFCRCISGQCSRPLLRQYVFDLLPLQWWVIMCNMVFVAFSLASQYSPRF